MAEEKIGLSEFKYVGTDPNTNKRVRGTVSAVDPSDAAGKVSRMNGLKAITVKEVSGIAKLLSSSNSTGTSRERLDYLRSLSLSLSTGSSSRVALHNAALHLREGSAMRNQAELLATAAEGQSIAEAFNQHSKVWGEDVAQIVEAGSETGNLGEILDTLVTSKENEIAIKKQVRKTLRKPLPAVIAVILLVYVSLTRILPTMIETFEGALEVELPGITLFAISMGGYITSWGPIAFLLLITLVAGVYMASRSERYGLRMAEVRIKLPLFGKVIYGGAISRAADVMAMSLTAKARPYEACGWAAKSVNNLYIQKALLDTRESLLNGTEFPEAVKQNIPPLPHEFQALAAQSNMGSVDNGAHWRRYATAAIQDTKHKAERVNDLLELFIPVIVMGVIGFIGAAIMLPQYEAVAQMMKQV